MNDSRGNGALGFLLGAATGAVAASLLTPKSGPEVRREISDKAREYTDEATEWARSASGTAGMGVQRAGDRTRETVNGFKELANAQKLALMEAFEEGRRAYRKELERNGRTVS